MTFLIAVLYVPSTITLKGLRMGDDYLSRLEETTYTAIAVAVPLPSNFLKGLLTLMRKSLTAFNLVALTIHTDMQNRGIAYIVHANRF